MKKFFLLVFISIVLVSALDAKNKQKKFEKGEIPKNVFIVTQTSEMSETFITAIDLDNNELVIIQIEFDGKYWCFRTGMICDPNKQIFREGKSAPFKPKQN